MIQENIKADKYPSKIKNLSLLQELGFDCLPFIVISSEDMNKIEQETPRIINFFQFMKIQNVIIRSAGFGEDSADKTMAGFFKSSQETPLRSLNPELIRHFWSVNKKKADSIGHSELFIFIQEYFKADYSGVLFTQTPYDSEKSVLQLSSFSCAVTAGEKPERTIIYVKNSHKWQDEGFLSKENKIKLQILIDKIEETFSDGADIELGIKKDEVKIYQVRPIVRNNNEKILLFEKKRLQDIFQEEFEHQIWERRDSFIQTIGNLKPLSLSFYNYLLNSKELYLLLKEAKVINERRNQTVNYRILENIGGKTYLNFTQEKKLFFKQTGWFNSFKRTVSLLSYEKIMREKSSNIFNEKFLTMEETFSWFFLSGVYLQIFLEREKQRYNHGDFVKRLKNTEIICNALEPRLQGLDDKSIDDFIKENYYLADCPYELASIRISEQKRGGVIKKYTHLKERAKNVDTNECLSSKIRFWLKKKNIWKQRFLKLLSEHRKELLRKYGKEIFNATNWEEIVKKGGRPVFQKDAFDVLNEKLSSSYLRISGKNYPFSDERNQEDFIIVPGDIDFQNIIHLTKEGDISQYLNQYIAVRTFPNYWIPFIPQIKGIILQEGNELSHMAITCREYEIPCKIMPGFFNEDIKNNN